MVIHPADGRLASDARLGSGVKQMTYTRQRWVLREAGVVWKQGSYQVHGKHLNESDGIHVDTFETYVR